MMNLLRVAITTLIIWSGNVAFAHIGSALLPEGCGSCHVGHGISGEPMLEESEEEFCYKCHGSDDKRSAMISSGRLSAAAKLADLEEEFNKSYSHPVEHGFGHSPVEKLPSITGGAPSHAECVDCHNPHQRVSSGRGKYFEVSGYSISGQYLETSINEYEICLKCHTGTVGFDRSSIDLMSEFSTGSGSQHPVTRGASGRKLPSLSKVMGRGTSMDCSDCHSNDDADGPRGPHGSNHKYLLSGNYDTDPFAEESSYAYEFCYFCHDRFSILSNESFPYHREHIEGDPVENIPGTSCYTCHASHGSRDNKNLIEFNLNAVTGDSKTGIIRYISTGNGKGECYLTCHKQAHNPARYSK
ncbi:MAG: hypothetical protein JSW64_10205 [Candidatus Zixiibacteriota bacterium]|nr:MAG: hypothetical protein JSW64_10205 [candidate division Zixibacteria bacterium]